MSYKNYVKKIQFIYNVYTKSKLIRLLLLVPIFLQTLVLHAQNDAISLLNKDYPALMEMYGEKLKSQKADFIIAIDISGTMLNHQTIVVPAIKRFIQSLPDGDFVSFIKFGTIASEHGLSGKISADTKNSLTTIPDNIYTRDPLFFSNTDLFLMSDKISQFMSRPEANDMKYIFMFTDFIHQPSYNHSKAEWDDLIKKIEALSKNCIIRSFAMKLPGSESGRDIELIRKAFPDLQTIEVANASLLNQWFETQRAGIIRNRLIDMVLGDIDIYKKNNLIDLKGRIKHDGNIELSLIADNKLPSYIKGFLFEKGNLEEKTKLQSIQFTPKVLVLKNKAASIGKAGFDSKIPTVFSPFANCSVEGKLIFDEKIQEDIINLGIADKIVLSKQVSCSNWLVLAWPIWLFIAAFSLFIVFVFLLIQICILPYKLGNFNLLLTESGKQIPEVHGFPNNKKVTIGDKRQDIPILGIDFPIIFRGRRGFPFFWLLNRKVQVKYSSNNSENIVVGDKDMKNGHYYNLKPNSEMKVYGSKFLSARIALKKGKGNNKNNLQNILLVFAISFVILLIYFFIFN